MRLKLLLRRLTVSAPRMAVRSALPWPLRWLALAVVAGFCAAIGLWAFEFGKDIAGLDHHSTQQWQTLQAETAALRSQLLQAQQQRDKAQSVANTADTELTTQKVTQERLSQQIQQLQADNQRLRDDLGFFERLIPSAGGEGVAIRSLQVDPRQGNSVRWQVLLLQPRKNAPEFHGQLELTFSGQLGGKPWSAQLPAGALSVTLTQYGRFEGTFEIPPQVVLRSVSARLLEDSRVRSSQTAKV